MFWGDNKVMTKKEKQEVFAKMEEIRLDAYKHGKGHGREEAFEHIRKNQQDQKLEAINKFVSNIGQTIDCFNKLMNP
jgi:hypothetical protein